MSSEVCAVCTAPAHGTHFGVKSCRACAAFFKRSVAGNRAYKCHHSGGKCLINKDVRCMCRACRYKKCIMVGMIGDGSPSEQMSPSTSSECSFSQTADVLFPSLKRISEGLSKMHEEFKRSAPSLKRPVPISFDMVSHYSKQYISSVDGFIKDHIPDVNLYSEDELLALSRSFTVKFIFLDSGNNTAKKGSFDRIYFYDGNFADIGNLEHYFSPFKGPEFTAADAARIFKPSFEKLVNNLVRPMHSLSVTPIEMAALILVLFYEPGLDCLSKSSDEKLMASREKVLRELIFYYRYEMRMPDFPIRMSKLMMILPCIERAADTFREDMQINKMFAQMEKDNGHLLMLERLER